MESLLEKSNYELHCTLLIWFDFDIIISFAKSIPFHHPVTKKNKKIKNIVVDYLVTDYSTTLVVTN